MYTYLNLTLFIIYLFLDYQAKINHKEFIYGYHSSQLPPYTIADCRRFINIIIPAIKTLFQFIVTIFKTI